MDSAAGAKARLSTLFDKAYLKGKTSAVSYTVDIDAYVTPDKSEFDGLAQNLQTGLSQIETEFSSFSGTFSSHSNDMEWAKNIEGEWYKKAKIDEHYQRKQKMEKNSLRMM